jgi:hypothetical protein
MTTPTVKISFSEDDFVNEETKHQLHVDTSMEPLLTHNVDNSAVTHKTDTTGNTTERK